MQLQARAASELKKRKSAKTNRLQSLLRQWNDDFPAFAKQLDVVDKVGNRIKVVQSPILLAYEPERSGRDFVLKPRQVFMTTWELARDLWFFFTKPGSRVVVLCQSDRANEAIKQLSDRIRTMLGTDETAVSNPDQAYGLLGKYPELRGPGGFVEHSQTRWSFGTSKLQISGAGATLKSAGKKGRAGTIHRLHVTEVAFFEYATDTLTAILECVPPRANGTEIVFESTPNGASGYFYEKYTTAKTGSSGYKAHFFRWFEQPEYREKLNPGEVITPRTDRERELMSLHGVTQEQIKWYRFKVADQGQTIVDQEFPSDEQTCWLFDGRIFFDRDSLSRLKTGSKEPEKKLLGGMFKIWFEPEPGKFYVLSADPANTGGIDPSAAVVLERGTGRHMATLCGIIPADEFGEHLARIGVYYNYALISVERSASYETVHTSLQKWQRPTKDGVGYPYIYTAEDKKLGFHLNVVTRPAVLDGLEVAMRKNEFVTFDRELVEECQLFIVKKDKPQAATGAHDDRVLATAIGWKLVTIPVGLKHTEFDQAPSIAFERTPVALEGTFEAIDKIADSELRRWAGGTSSASPSAGGIYSHYNGNDLDGF